MGLDLKDQLIKLGTVQPDLQPHLKPILDTLARTASSMGARRIEGILKDVWKELDRVGYFVNRHEDFLLVHTISGSGPETIRVNLFLDPSGNLKAEYRDVRDRMLTRDGWGDYYLDTHRDDHVVDTIVKTVKKLD